MDIQEELARYTRAEMDYWDFSGVIRIIQMVQLYLKQAAAMQISDLA